MTVEMPTPKNDYVQPDAPTVAREKVFVTMPSMDRRIDIGTMAGLMACTPYYHMPFILAGMSNISLARNELAHIFLHKTEYEWCMMLDSDIVFTREDWELLWEGDEDVVTAEYAKKILGQPPAKFGLGFTRVHRSVFEKINALQTPEGTEYAGRFYHKGAMMTNFFPNGPTGESRWLSEDHGFFMLCAMTDVKPRLETRTKLKHVGSIEYCYPDQLPGYFADSSN